MNLTATAPNQIFIQIVEWHPDHKRVYTINDVSLYTMFNSAQLHEKPFRIRLEVKIDQILKFHVL